MHTSIGLEGMALGTKTLKFFRKDRHYLLNQNEKLFEPETKIYMW